MYRKNLQYTICTTSFFDTFRYISIQNVSKMYRNVSKCILVFMLGLVISAMQQSAAATWTAYALPAWNTSKCPHAFI